MLWLTHSSLNYPCLEQISKVPKIDIWLDIVPVRIITWISWLTHSSSNYPCLEQISKVPKIGIWLDIVPVRIITWISWLTHSSSNYPCLEQISKVPKIDIWLDIVPVRIITWSGFKFNFFDSLLKFASSIIFYLLNLSATCFFILINTVKCGFKPLLSG